MSSRLQTFAAAALGIGITLWLFYPGWMSVDSAVQYQQALAGRYDDAHPPLLAWLWHHINRIWPGPGGLFVLLTTVWWSALAELATRVHPGWRGALAALLIGLLPPVLLIAAHLWKDVALSASLLAASAAILAFRRDGGTWLAAMAVAWLAAAVCFRHNGWPAALPLVLWLVWPRSSTTAWGLSRLAATLGLMAALAVVPGIVSRALDAAPRDAFSAVVLWDLGAVSIATGEMLIPPEVRAPDLAPADLEAGYVTWANPAMFEVAPIRLGIHGPYSAEDRRAVLGAWFAMIRAHPRAYLAHRAQVSRHLLFGPPAEAPRELVYVPARILPPEASIVLPELNRSRDRFVIAIAERLRTTPLFAGATWLALALAAAAFAWPRRHSEAARAALALAFSALAYALPLALVTGSAEFRYLHWSVIAALLAMLAAFTARQRASSDNERHEHP